MGTGFFRKIHAAHRAASLTGYGLVVGLIAILAIGAISTTGDSVTDLFVEVDSSLTEAGGGSSGAGSSGPAPNVDPVAGSPSLEAVSPGGSTFLFSEVLAGTTDGNGDTLTITAVDNPTGGTVSLGAGDVTFTPSGTDDFGSFEFTVSDGNGGTSVGTASVDNLNPPVAGAPALAADGSMANTYTFSEVLTGSTDIDVADVLTISAVGSPTGGTVSLGVSDITFTPNGVDTSGSFEFTVDDQNGGTDVGTASITITLPFAATGGNSTYTVGSDNVHVFTSSGDFTVTGGSQTVDYLIVGAGGAGAQGLNGYTSLWGSGTYIGGGGGGGGEVLSGSILLSPNTYSITIGAGTAGFGGDSIAFGLTADGGESSAGNGGNSGNGNPGGTGGSNSSGQSGRGGGGGGGAGSAGSSSSVGFGSAGASGGSGVTSSISGSSVTYGRGGDGGDGGQHGTGNTAPAGASNTGNGGEGGEGTSGTNGPPINTNKGGNGGSGIVIIRYPQ